ncbi:MAG TPA: Rossmann-like and DUF2520 domain-containing protein [Candidatus Acidoferrum sp.]|nr:Rossmann-like and DUF2520 domain-containing protein [Candidatus Acidoferrum sp.]
MATTLAIVGGGRVGRALGRELHRAGWNISAVVTRSAASARKAVRAIGAGQPFGGLTGLILGANVALISVPDDKISDVARRLARVGGEEWRGKVALHTSGALDSSVLAPLAALGVATGSLHPMQTFASRMAPPLAGVWMVMEGKPAALAMARRIAHGVGGIPVRLHNSNKLAYHAANVFAAGHVLALLEAGVAILTHAGFSRREASTALIRLTRQVLLNFERFGPAAAWTGPAARGDFGTIAAHARALQNFPREYQEAYAAVHRLGARVLARRPEAMLTQLDRALAPTSGKGKHGGRARK